MALPTPTPHSHSLTLEPLPSAPQAILDTLELTARIKKTPVVVGNCTGFAVNRVFFPYTMASCMLVRSLARPAPCQMPLLPRLDSGTP